MTVEEQNDQGALGLTVNLNDNRADNLHDYCEDDDEDEDDDDVVLFGDTTLGGDNDDDDVAIEGVERQVEDAGKKEEEEEDLMTPESDVLFQSANEIDPNAHPAKSSTSANTPMELSSPESNLPSPTPIIAMTTTTTTTTTTTRDGENAFPSVEPFALDNRPDNQRHRLRDSGFEGLGSLEELARSRQNVVGGGNGAGGGGGGNGSGGAIYNEIYRTERDLRDRLNADGSHQLTNDSRPYDANDNDHGRGLSPRVTETSPFLESASYSSTKEQSSSVTLSESAVNEFNRRGRYPTSSQMMSKWLFDQQMSLADADEATGKKKNKKRKKKKNSGVVVIVVVIY